MSTADGRLTHRHMVSVDSLVDRRTRGRKDVFRYLAGAAGKFSSPELTFFADTYSVSDPLHVKDPGHSAKNAGGRLHLNTHSPLTLGSPGRLTMLTGHSVGTYQVNKLTRNSSGNARQLSSQLAEPLCTDPGLNSGTGARELI